MTLEPDSCVKFCVFCGFSTNCHCPTGTLNCAACQYNGIEVLLILSGFMSQVYIIEFIAACMCFIAVIEGCVCT